MKFLLTVTAVLEGTTGLGLVTAPSVIARLLLGAPLDAPAAVTVARVAGAALLALGVAMLVYNVAAVAILAHAATGLSLSGIGLWPTIGLHTALAGWCAIALKSARPTPSH